MLTGSYIGTLKGFLGAFVIFRKVTISFVKSACLSVRMQQLVFHSADFHEIWYSSIFRTSMENISVSLKITRLPGTLHEYQYAFIIVSHSVLLGMRNFTDKSCTEIPNTFYVQYFFNLRVYDKEYKYFRAVQATDDNMAQAYSMMDT